MELAKGNKGWRTCSKRTICEVHRQIYDKLILSFRDKSELEEILVLLEEAFSLGVKLVDKLVEYKCSLPEWEKNENKNEVERIRHLREDLRNARINGIRKRDVEKEIRKRKESGNKKHI